MVEGFAMVEFSDLYPALATRLDILRQRQTNPCISEIYRSLICFGGDFFQLVWINLKTDHDKAGPDDITIHCGSLLDKIKPFYF